MLRLFLKGFFARIPKVSKNKKGLDAMKIDLCRYRTFFLTVMTMAACVVALPAETAATSPPLHWAARRGQTGIAKMLLEGGVEVDASDHFGNTALHAGIRYREIVALLLEYGADINAKNAMGNTPLHLAVRDKDVVDLLIQNGANVNARNGLDKTPLYYSMRGGTHIYNISIIETLINSGAGIK